MFKKIFIDLCNQRGEAPSYVCRKIGISPAAFSQWTDATIPRQGTVKNAAEYFNVSINYLLGKEAIPSIAAIAREAKDLSAVPTPNDTDIVIKVPLSALTHKLSKLDEIDLEKVEAYTDGLLAAEKYQTSARIKKA